MSQQLKIPGLDLEDNNNPSPISSKRYSRSFNTSESSGNVPSFIIQRKKTETQSPTKISFFSAPQASKNDNLIKLVSGIFNESFGYRPDGRQYRLGPKSTAERLESTDFLFLAGGEEGGIGYLFGKEIPCSSGRVSWIESMAVLPLYRRQGIGTALVKEFVKKTKGSLKLGCATPNPIAALVITGIVSGNLYISPRQPGFYIKRMLREIRKHCFDLRGCKIDDDNFRIKTGFSPLSRSDQRDWYPRTSAPPPFWWKGIENLPNDYEALLVIERNDSILNSNSKSIQD